MTIILWFLAAVSVAMAFGTWLGFRLSEESQRITDLTTYVLSIPDEEWRK